MGWIVGTLLVVFGLIMMRTSITISTPSANQAESGPDSNITASGFFSGLFFFLAGVVILVLQALDG